MLRWLNNVRQIVAKLIKDEERIPIRAMISLEIISHSVSGCKTNNITIVYTPFTNLKKTQGMDVGQVGFHDPKEVRSVVVDRKVGEIVNRLNKTKEWKKPDLRLEREERDRRERQERRKMELEEVCMGGQNLAHNT